MKKIKTGVLYLIVFLVIFFSVYASFEISGKKLEAMHEFSVS